MDAVTKHAGFDHYWPRIYPPSVCAPQIDIAAHKQTKIHKLYKYYNT